MRLETLNRFILIQLTQCYVHITEIGAQILTYPFHLGGAANFVPLMCMFEGTNPLPPPPFFFKIVACRLVEATFH